MDAVLAAFTASANGGSGLVAGDPPGFLEGLRNAVARFAATRTPTAL